MKRTAAIAAAAAFALAAPMMVSTAMDMDHGSMNMEHGGKPMKNGNFAHEEVSEGIKASFTMINMKEHMKGMQMPAGIKETHHLMVTFTDVKSGKTLTEGVARTKVIAPDKSEQVRNMMSMGAMAGMAAGYGADFDFSKTGKYGVITKFKAADGKVRTYKFWYTVK